MKPVIALLGATAVIAACGSPSPGEADTAGAAPEPAPCLAKENSIGFHTGSAELSGLAHDLAVEVVENRAADCPDGTVHVVTYRGEGDDMAEARQAAILAVLSEAGVPEAAIDARIEDAALPENAGRTLVRLSAD